MSTVNNVNELPFVVCVEGNIGSGKSTLLKNFSENGLKVIAEPVEDVWGQYLPKLYEDQARWGFCFQMEVIDWFRQLTDRIKGGKGISKGTTAKKMPDTGKQKEHGLERHRESHGVPLDLSRGDDKENQDPHAPQQPRRSQGTLVMSDEIMLTELDRAGDDEIHSDVFSCDPLLIAPSRSVSVLSNSHSPRDPSPFPLSSFPSKKGGLDRLKRHLTVIERSATSAFEIFGKNLRETGCMSSWEYSLLRRFYLTVDWRPKFILYLRTDADICSKRIAMRNRDGESKVPHALIVSLHRRHENLFGRKRKSNWHVIELNGNESKEVVFKEALFKLNQMIQKNLAEKCV